MLRTFVTINIDIHLISSDYLVIITDTEFVLYEAETESVYIYFVRTG